MAERGLTGGGFAVRQKACLVEEFAPMRQPPIQQITNNGLTEVDYFFIFVV